MEPGVVIEADGGVLRMCLDRPERKNSLDLPTVMAIVRALEDAATDDTLRVIHLTASGDNFCTGSELTGTKSDEKPRVGSIQRRVPLQHNRVVELLLEIQLPVVCEVRGWAAGLGCNLALAADFTVAADTATFWYPFAQRGFSPDSGSTWLLPRLVGVARAKELLLLGRKLSGTEAAEWGMIHRAVPEAELADSAAALIDQLASAATVALGFAKHCIQRSLVVGLDEAMDLELQALELTSRSSDFREGLSAFKERRDPEFEGR